MCIAGCLGIACGGEPSAAAEAAASGEGPTTGSSASGGADSESEGTETGEGGGSPLGPFGGRCIDAAPLGAGRVRGNLRDRNENEGGACGLGGPEVYFTVELPQRADLFIDMVGAEFTPRLDWISDDCVESRSFACTQLPTFAAYDLAAGARLRFSVGIDPTEPALGVPWSPGEPDPLDFELAVDFRPVSGLGEPCSVSSLARCGGGLVCNDAGLCERLDGNACAAPLSAPVPLPGQSEGLVIEPGGAWTDVHQHSCGADRWPERVFRLPRASLGALAGSELEISQVEGPSSLTLALRGPGCLGTSELACTSAPLQNPLRIPVDGLLAAGPGDLYLFVEQEQALEGPATLTLTAVDP